MARFVVGISGASGVCLAHRAIKELIRLKHHVELVISRVGTQTLLHEMGEQFSSPQKLLQSYSEQERANIRLHQINDFTSPIASGSFQHDGCLIIPCSMATLAAIANGFADNLLRRAADVTLKEGRKLVIVPRETPLHEIHLENMLRLRRMGVCIVPPEPAWYLLPKSMEEMEQSLVQRILDQLGIDIGGPRWNGTM